MSLGDKEETLLSDPHEGNLCRIEDKGCSDKTYRTEVLVEQNDVYDDTTGQKLFLGDHPLYKVWLVWGYRT